MDETGSIWDEDGNFVHTKRKNLHCFSHGNILNCKWNRSCKTIKRGGAASMQKKKVISHRKRDSYKLFFMVLPFLILAFVFSYLPLSGWRYAFYNYRPGFPLDRCEYVGFKWFLRLVNTPAQTREIIRVMTNTLAMSFLHLATSVLPMVFAIFLSEIRSPRYRKAVQILTTLPNFISWVLVYSVAYALFSVDTGFVNRILMALGQERGINFLASSEHIWIKMTLWHIWKSLGWSSIMYLAAISGIDQELYEAAEVDGANRYQRMWHITVPGLLPTFFVLMMLSIGNLINTGMESYFVFSNAMNKDTIEVLDLYVYNIGINGRNFSLATAIGMLKSLVSIVLLIIANTSSKLIRGQSIM